MASKAFLANLNLNGNELQNVVIQPLAAPPANPKLGLIYTNSGDGLLYQYNGTDWKPVGAVLSVNGKIGVVVLTQDDVGDGSTYVRTHNDLTDALVARINSALQPGDKGVANGVASLDSAGKVPAAQLPSYVDDVIEGYYYNSHFYSDAEHTQEITGETGKIYVDLSTANAKAYRWSGTVFVEISQGTVVSTATDTITSPATSATVNYTGNLLNAYATMDDEEVLLDVTVGLSSVTFAAAAAPSSPVTCTVVYI